ncbi:MAG: 3D domain-containing protein [Chthoniobacterales bacterium]
MPNLVRLAFLGALASLLVSCAAAPVASTSTTAAAAKNRRIQKVRTTAYTHNEGSGGQNAIGHRLAGGRLKSAASDWSRYPLGTRFRVLSTGDEYVIDDYGGALVGTNTIDLYKPTTLEMRRWGVRHVDIEVIEWGSDEESLKVLRPRRFTRLGRRMIASLESKKN